ncbi:GatB/YqeY domain-containing protein [Draconibacterium sp. IB214405]|uniref:GatB/YqeY domain-containing protein n=1 Tax=Draconibacterium sp. IB214405 TaxID=3097352 RepID=UPI002A0CED7C|nr:GatB/YqeY domain-containing protein [Draconibacterium sp. IB214405]MDX8338593.1 GatB/YqeY domain-containing protein [Draconibacterium sp. IB214405]
MAIFDQINEDIKAAMKAREKDKLEALRGIKKVMIEAQTAKGAGEVLADEDALKIISKLAKQGSDSATIYKEQGRDDLYEQEMKQVAIFESYLPAKMSDEDLTAAVKAVIEQVGASSMKDMGKVMGIASKKLAGQADGKDIADKVKALLA